MSYTGIGSPIPNIASLPGQTGGEVEVTLDYPSAAVCNDDGILTPTFDPAGGVFEATPTGLNIDTSTGVVTPTGSTPQDYTISYTVSGVVSSFDLTINAVQQSTFSYASNSFQDSGTALPTLAGGTTSGGTFVSSSPSDLTVNASTGELTLASATVGGPYTITYTTPGPCARSSTFQISITATVRIIANNFALDFNGTDQYVSAGNPTQFQITNALTVSTWFKILNNSGNRALVTRDTGDTQRNWSLYITGTGTLRLLLRNNTDSAWNIVVSSLSYDDGEWHHGAFVYTPSTSLILYVDGIAVDTNTTSITPSINNLTADFTIGAYSPNQGYTGDRWTGDIDEVAVWNKAISANAVQEIYNATINNPGFTADLFKLANESQAPVYWNRMGDD